jgi:hypothetical protein
MRAISVVWAAALLSSVVACGSSPSPRIADEDAAKLLINRNWIDRMPETHSDRLHVFRFVPGMGGGVFQDRTLFKGEFELFVFRVHGSQLEFLFPDNGDRVRSHYTIEKVEGPAPFDLKLTLDATPRGPRVYYGIKAETDPHGEALEARLAKLAN